MIIEITLAIFIRREKYLLEKLLVSFQLEDYQYVKISGEFHHNENKQKKSTVSIFIQHPLINY